MRFIISIVLAAALVWLTGPANAGTDTTRTAPELFAALAVLHTVAQTLPPNEGSRRLAHMSISTASLLADWITTLDIERARNERRNGLKYYEDGGARQFIGSEPDRGSVNRYFLSLIAAHFVGNYLINQIENKRIREFARLTENVTVSFMHGPAARSNIKIGLSLSREF